MQQWVKEMSKNERAEGKLARTISLEQEAESSLEIAMLRARNPNDLRAQLLLRKAQADLVFRGRAPGG